MLHFHVASLIQTGVQAPFENTAYHTAIRTHNTYTCGSNLFWSRFDFSPNPRAQSVARNHTLHFASDLSEVPLPPLHSRPQCIIGKRCHDLARPHKMFISVLLYWRCTCCRNQFTSSRTNGQQTCNMEVWAECLCACASVPVCLRLLCALCACVPWQGLARALVQVLFSIGRGLFAGGWVGPEWRGGVGPATGAL